MAHASVFCDENAAFDEFCRRFGHDAGTEVLERIADASWSHPRGGVGVSIDDVHTINACNHVYSGTIEHAGERFGFIIESGDRNGTVILGWGDPEDVGTHLPEEPTVYTFAPRRPLCDMPAGLVAVYQAWTKEKWFTDAVQAYNYDRHFAPGGKTEQHYRALAEKRGLRIVTTDEAAPYLARIHDAAAHNAAVERGRDLERKLANLFAPTPDDGDRNG